MNNIQNISQALPTLSVMELDELMTQILRLRRQKLPTVLTQSETELLQKINAGLPLAIQKRYDFLIKKRQSETLHDAEYEELLELTAYSENHNNQRLKHLLELASIRSQSLDDIIRDLGIKPRVYGT
jgi:hypothetical protein